MLRRKAFTLVEVLVALAIGGLVLVGAQRVLATMSDEAHAIGDRVADADRRANGEQMLRTLVGRLEIGSSNAMSFTGTERATSFSSWCEVPAGWLERCVVSLAFDTLGSRPVLLARLDHGRPIVLARDFTQGTFRYLESAGTGGQWLRLWGTGITTPLAIGVILDRDTLIVRVGERG